MKQITREWLAFLREQYPVGSRIRLNSMEDPYAPVEPGTMGTLQRIDDAGQFLMKWDNGRTLSLIPGEDSFSLILPEPTMMKLYMPLHADLYTKDDWSDTSEEPEMLTGRALMEYEDSILIALIKNRMSEEAERGIMRWYGREDSVDRKVKSVVFTAEEREGQLWGVAECKVDGELTPEELDIAKPIKYDKEHDLIGCKKSRCLSPDLRRIFGHGGRGHLLYGRTCNPGQRRSQAQISSMKPLLRHGQLTAQQNIKGRMPCIYFGLNLFCSQVAMRPPCVAIIERAKCLKLLI